MGEKGVVCHKSWSEAIKESGKMVRLIKEERTCVGQEAIANTCSQQGWKRQRRKTSTSFQKDELNENHKNLKGKKRAILFPEKPCPVLFLLVPCDPVIALYQVNNVPSGS